MMGQYSDKPAGFMSGPFCAPNHHHGKRPFGSFKGNYAFRVVEYRLIALVGPAAARGN